MIRFYRLREKLEVRIRASLSDAAGPPRSVIKAPQRLFTSSHGPTGRSMNAMSDSFVNYDLWLKELNLKE